MRKSLTILLIISSFGTAFTQQKIAFESLKTAVSTTVYQPIDIVF
jgi:hypothetical protein